ncbi:hypothetical protein CK203_103089 [Vitis vinifera]|uniref:Reverse transcriptase domain-containing protein n=1 Tax=Vitis vinifera TaxID=29760 RepID=A0A438CVN6_VITVI|nr:hypothetical protein CK203_103089 [Vitis vinifera]
MLIHVYLNISTYILQHIRMRLRGVLHETIHSTQGAFVQGRQILDAVLIANEIVNEKRRLGKEGVVFKIDFEKAYDHNHLSKLAELLDCKASGWPILYLGLPLGGNPKACGFWDPMIERISKRLDGWQKAYLSFEVEGKRGLGFGKIALRNVALLGKWLWSQMVTSLSLEGYCTSLSGVFQVYSICGRRWGKNSILGRLVVGGPTFGIPISKTI